MSAGAAVHSLGRTSVGATIRSAVELPVSAGVDAARCVESPPAERVCSLRLFCRSQTPSAVLARSIRWPPESNATKIARPADSPAKSKGREGVARFRRVVELARFQAMEKFKHSDRSPFY